MNPAQKKLALANHLRPVAYSENRAAGEALHHDLSVRLRPAAYSEEDAAAYVCQSPSALRKARYRGDLPAVIFRGRAIRYLVTDLDAYLAKNRFAGGKDRAVGSCAVWRKRRSDRMKPVQKALTPKEKQGAMERPFL